MRQDVTCVVVDDHPPIVEAVAAFLELHGLVAHRALDGATGIELIRERRPDVALVDLRMPRVGGMDVLRAAGRSAPETAVLLYTAYGEGANAIEALDAGARGFLLKEAPLEEVLRAIELAAGGGTYIDPTVAAELVRPHAHGAPATLTARERDVLRLLADGLSNEEVGRRLHLSGETVRTHVRKAMRKLGAGTRVEAVAKALRLSLIG